MEKTSRNTISNTFSFIDIVGALFFRTILNWVNRFQLLYSKFLSIFQSHLEDGKATKNVARPRQHSYLNEKGDAMLNGEDIEMVMTKMGICCSSLGCLDRDEFSVLFEEMEPSFEEVKEAFAVFDVNKDGFIDANELQRVLCNLDFREALNLDACERMIGAFDKNRDGRIDFNDFVKIMENSFC